MVGVVAYGVTADERPLLERALGEAYDLRCLDLVLNRDTVATAAGRQMVCSGVNDVLDEEVLRILADGGTELVTQRATGYNNIDLAAARALGVTVARVSWYSPYAVAEHRGPPRRPDQRQHARPARCG
ncbi:hypothetical protein [Streptomyces hesseae]|uniref:D-isomer specific 2-hydroxyacid dehydrogenase catalytic domain-containing protein n=1 Tax=Streptomyces hesseae TaxID=3075519 RepID=A0ABU2SKN9_9ACTN|nr:hypothetical protein [Streptomyces sp. DSM 40473]MDT0449541.1 hypothetical protein [Streptomyces sp. DSM 40473]